MTRCAPLALLASLACGTELAPPDGGSPDTGLEVAEIQVGTGRLDGSAGFVEQLEGSPIELSPGAQGGFHVFVNLRVPAELIREHGDVITVRRHARRERDRVLVSRTERLEQLVLRDGAYETETSLLLFMCPTPIGIEVADEAITLQVELLDEPGGTPVGAGSMRYVPVCPEGDVREFCLDICFG